MRVEHGGRWEFLRTRVVVLVATVAVLATGCLGKHRRPLLPELRERGLRRPPLRPRRHVRPEHRRVAGRRDDHREGPVRSDPLSPRSGRLDGARRHRRRETRTVQPRRPRARDRSAHDDRTRSHLHGDRRLLGCADRPRRRRLLHDERRRAGRRRTRGRHDLVPRQRPSARQGDVHVPRQRRRTRTSVVANGVPARADPGAAGLDHADLGYAPPMASYLATIAIGTWDIRDRPRERLAHHRRGRSRTLGDLADSSLGTRVRDHRLPRHAVRASVSVRGRRRHRRRSRTSGSRSRTRPDRSTIRSSSASAWATR